MKQIKAIKATAIKSAQGFYIGDICYVLDDEVYYGVWGKNGYVDGQYKADNGYAFAVASTMYGDGCYDDDDGNVYGVDAGVLGIVPLELVSDVEKAREDGLVVECNGEATMYAREGDFHFELPNGKKVHIDTM